MLHTIIMVLIVAGANGGVRIHEMRFTTLEACRTAVDQIKAERMANLAVTCVEQR